MPYIDERIRPELEPISARGAFRPGELNFQITMLCVAYLTNLGESYTTLNAIVGALECAKLEFYRRIAASYEDEKVVANGDVYR